jgi:hypothetical protein
MKSSLAVLFVLIAASAACGGSGSDASTPVTPTPVTPTPPAEVRLAVFMDSASGFSTSDVHDVNDEIVRFDTTSSSLIWAADGRTFPGFPVHGNDIGDFRVRFGTKNGQRAAYWTESSRPNICDLQVTNGQLLISATDVPVPGS